MINLVIGIKSINIEDQNTALNFIQAVFANFIIKLNVVFVYQNAVNFLLNNQNHYDNNYENSYENVKLKNNQLTLIGLIEEYNLTVKVCKSACKKRGIQIVSPFIPATIIEFINYCNTADRIIQF